MVRQPVDIGFSPDDYRTFLTRLAMAVNGRFPLVGLAVAVALAPTPHAASVSSRAAWSSA